jgi:hypothetical protein
MEKVPIELKKYINGKPSVWMENLVYGMKGYVDEGVWMKRYVKDKYIDEKVCG